MPTGLVGIDRLDAAKAQEATAAGLYASIGIAVVQAGHGARIACMWRTAAGLGHHIGRRQQIHDG